VHLDPAAARRLPPTIHHEFLQAFAHALHGVFLWGVGFAAVSFALSWMLKEIPLRTTTRPGHEGLENVEHAAAAGPAAAV
jgi:hypothetical protein